MKAKDAMQFVLDRFDPETFETGAAGCPSRYFDGLRNICTLPGRAGLHGNCMECWNQEVMIRGKQEQTDAPDQTRTITFTLEDLTIAFYNVVSSAVEDYGGNADRLYSYTRGVCDLVDALAELVTGGGEQA